MQPFQECLGLMPGFVRTLSGKLDRAISKAESDLLRLEQQVRDAECLISRMKDTRSKVHELVWADTDSANVLLIGDPVEFHAQAVE